MNDVTTFNFRSHNVRTVLKDGEPWFVAKDVCDVLNLSDTSMTLQSLDDDEKGTSTVCTLSNTTEMTHLRFQVSTYKDPSMATRSHCRGVAKRYPIIDTTEALRPLDDDKKITLSNSEGHSGQRGRALPRHAGYKSPYRTRGYQPIQFWIG